MIELVAGKVGGGKTYYAVTRIVGHLAKGGTVYTNIALVRPRVCRYVLRRWGVVIRRDQLRSLELNLEKGFHASLPMGDPSCPVLVVLDEIHLFFNARDWQKSDQMQRETLSWFSQSRKAGVDVILIAQKSDTIDGQIRAQAEFLLYTRDLRRWPLPWLGPVKMPIFVRAYKDVESGHALETKFDRIDNGIFPLYDTRSFLDDRMRDWAKGRKRVTIGTARRVGSWGQMVHSCRVLRRKFLARGLALIAWIRRGLLIDKRKKEREKK